MFFCGLLIVCYGKMSILLDLLSRLSTIIECIFSKLSPGLVFVVGTNSKTFLVSKSISSPIFVSFGQGEGVALCKNISTVITILFIFSMYFVVVSNFVLSWERKKVQNRKSGKFGKNQGKSGKSWKIPKPDEIPEKNIIISYLRSKPSIVQRNMVKTEKNQLSSWMFTTWWG